MAEGFMHDKCECGTVGVPLNVLPWAAALAGALAAAVAAFKRRA